VGVRFLKSLRLGIISMAILLSIPTELVSGQLAIDRKLNKNCPGDLKALTPLLLKDLPGYSNRVIQRTQSANREAGIENYIITAGKSEIKPLNLPQIQYNSIDNQAPEQIFFTVLERQYINKKVTDIQTYHWLFLTRSSSGWRMVMMFSRFGDSTANDPPTPPRETSDGIIGQGVQLWLRDCRAATIKN